jgi:hypothetical protein
MSDLYQWQPHRTSPYLLLEGHADAVVRAVKSPNGQHLWQYRKRYGYQPSIEEAKAMVEALADHFSIPPDQRWMKL